jgi:AcrR family transcriptional regulator
MPRVVNRSDPRVQRTRQLLLDTFMSLVMERHNIYSISIQEVATRANVNRATFYAHFEDKYELVTVWLCEKFQRALAQQLPASSTIQRETLHQLILTLFDFLALGQRDHSPADRELEPLFEIVLQRELYAYLLKWLKQVPSETPISAETLEVTAQAISWAIFGPAMRWSLGDRSTSAEDMTNHVLTVVLAGLSPVVTVG